MKPSTLELRMYSILRKNAITLNSTRGKYKAALQRLVRKGKARLTHNGWELSTREYLRS